MFLRFSIFPAKKNSKFEEKNVKTAIKPMDVQRFWSAMLTLGPPKNIENHQNTIGLAMVSVIS